YRGRAAPRSLRIVPGKLPGTSAGVRGRRDPAGPRAGGELWRGSLAAGASADRQSGRTSRVQFLALVPMAPLGFAGRARVVGARSFSGRTLLAPIVNAPRSGDRAISAAVRGGARTVPVDGNRGPAGGLATGANRVDQEQNKLPGGQ